MFVAFLFFQRQEQQRAAARLTCPSCEEIKEQDSSRYQQQRFVSCRFNASAIFSLLSQDSAFEENSNDNRQERIEIRVHVISLSFSLLVFLIPLSFLLPLLLDCSVYWVLDSTTFVFISTLIGMRLFGKLSESSETCRLTVIADSHLSKLFISLVFGMCKRRKRDGK